MLFCYALIAASTAASHCFKTHSDDDAFACRGFLFDFITIRVFRLDVDIF